MSYSLNVGFRPYGTVERCYTWRNAVALDPKGLGLIRTLNLGRPRYFLLILGSLQSIFLILDMVDAIRAAGKIQASRELT